MRAKASLTIRSSVLTSDFISQHLALEPDSSYDIGDPVSPERYPHGPFRKEALWRRASGLPDSASLAEHLQTLVDLLSSRTNALRSMRANSTQSLFCGLFGDYEMTASFEVPAYVVKWCSGILDIVLDCFSGYRSIPADVTEQDNNEADDEFGERDVIEPDRSLSYLASAGDAIPLRCPHEINGAPTDQLLPRPSAGSTSVITSDLPETADAVQQVARVIYMIRSQRSVEMPLDPELICLFSTDRVAGSFVRLDIPILQRLAHLGASFRFVVFQSPPALRRLRELS